MDRLLAVNEDMAIYYHDESTPAKKIDPFKYLNTLLSIRSAKGLVSFLQQYPDELVIMHEATAFKSKKDDGYVVGNYASRLLHTRKSKRSPLYSIEEDGNDEEKGKSSSTEADGDEAAGQKLSEEEASDTEQKDDEQELRPFTNRFSYGESALMSAASEHNVDYFDALTDLEKYTHYGEALKEWSKSMPEFSDQWTAEETRDFYLIHEAKPRPELRVVFLDELEFLVRRLEAILDLGALSHRIIPNDGLFEFEHVNGPMGLCRVTVPDHFVGNLLPIREAIYAIDNVHADYYSHSVNRIHFEDDEGIYILAHTNDEDLATQDVSGVIVSFVLSEWSNYYNKTDTMSFDVHHGFQLYEQENNPVVTELCRIVAEGRIGICPVCERPFVVKRRPVNGVINKRFCTNSCKVKGHMESKGGDSPTA